MTLITCCVEEVTPEDLKLPECPLPRPNERVCWFADARPVSGTVTGHSIHGSALVVNQFGNPTTKRFDEIRLYNPLERRKPNWHYLPESGKILRPTVGLSDTFERLLRQRIPPGPSYMDLVAEIWSRGYEVYLVGGTVRDCIAGQASKDVDLVTTMPLSRARSFLSSMYRYDPSLAKERGFIRIGGTPASGDPFIDLKSFSDSLPGTREATFGVGFDRDTCHRDFACNAVYYDPINKVMSDPTGRGVADSLGQTLSIICQSNDSHQHAQIFIRAIKFSLRGFVIAQETLLRMQNELANDITSMKKTTRSDYVRTQVFSKAPNRSEHEAILDQFRAQFYKFGFETVWELHFEPLVGQILHVQ